MFAAGMRVLSDNERKYSNWTLGQHFEIRVMLMYKSTNNYNIIENDKEQSPTTVTIVM
jgi:hypothetical protein